MRKLGCAAQKRGFACAIIILEMGGWLRPLSQNPPAPRPRGAGGIKGGARLAAAKKSRFMPLANALLFSFFPASFSCSRKNLQKITKISKKEIYNSPRI